MRKRFYVVCYDIKDDSRRMKVFKTMRNYGTRVQYSIFECILENDILDKMIDRISDIIKPDEDSIRVYYLPDEAKRFIKIIGVGEVVHEQKYFIV